MIDTKPDFLKPAARDYFGLTFIFPGKAGHQQHPGGDGVFSFCRPGGDVGRIGDALLIRGQQPGKPRRVM